MSASNTQTEIVTVKAFVVNDLKFGNKSNKQRVNPLNNIKSFDV